MTAVALTEVSCGEHAERNLIEEGVEETRAFTHITSETPHLVLRPSSKCIKKIYMYSAEMRRQQAVGPLG